MDDTLVIVIIAAAVAAVSLYDYLVGLVVPDENKKFCIEYLTALAALAVCICSYGFVPDYLKTLVGTGVVALGLFCWSLSLFFLDAIGTIIDSENSPIA